MSIRSVILYSQMSLLVHNNPPPTPPPSSSAIFMDYIRQVHWSDTLGYKFGIAFFMSLVYCVKQVWTIATGLSWYLEHLTNGSLDHFKPKAVQPKNLFTVIETNSFLWVTFLKILFIWSTWWYKYFKRSM